MYDIGNCPDCLKDVAKILENEQIYGKYWEQYKKELAQYHENMKKTI